MRKGNVLFTPRRRYDPVLTHLYNQGIQMGLPHDQAARILTIGRRPRTSSAYGNPAFGSPPAGVNRHRSSATFQHASLYGSQPGYVGYPHLAAPQVLEQYDQYNTTEPTASFAPHFVTGGTTYYSDPNQMTQAIVQYEPALPAEPIFEAGYSYNYDEYENYAPLNPVHETTETEHRYAHEEYVPEMYAGEPYVHESYTQGPGSGHGQEHH
jgi:hypothetical protein